MYASMVHLRILPQNYRNMGLEQSDGHKLLSTTTALRNSRGLRLTELSLLYLSDQSGPRSHYKISQYNK